MYTRKISLIFMFFVAISGIAQKTAVNTSATSVAKLTNMSPYTWDSHYFVANVIPEGNSWEDRHFIQALYSQQNKNIKDYYTVTNDDKKNISIEKLVNYCNKHNYLYKKDYKTDKIKKFGSSVDIVSEFYFLPKLYYPFYVFAWTDRKSVSHTSLTKNGSVYFYLPSENNFVILERALWSGDVVDGMLDGTGSGIFKKDENTYLYFSGQFKKGIPQGEIIHRIIDTNTSSWGYTKEEARKNNDRRGGIDYYSIEIGEWNEGLAPYRVPGNGNYGLLSSRDNTLSIAFPPTYSSFVTGYSNGKATVMKGNEEIIIDQQGNFIDYSAKQKKQNQLRAEEKKKKELADRQAQIERERQAKEAEKRRVEKFRNARPGDRVYYSKDYVKYGMTLFGMPLESNKSYTMRIVCFVEQNVDNGERLQIRVGSVESSRSDLYTTPEIDGIKYKENDVLWIKPLNDNKWQIE